MDVTEQTARNEVDEALDAAVVTAGLELLNDPKRLRAVVADLVGRPGADHRTQVEALVAAAEVWNGGDHGDGAEAADALEALDVDPDAGRWALRAIARHGATFASVRSPTGDAGRGGRSRPPWLIPGGAATAAIALIAVIALWPGPGPDETADDTTTTSSTTTTSTTTTTDPSQVVGYLVNFEPTLEGDVIAEREWTIRDGTVTGRVTLTPTDATGSIINHRELIPATAFRNSQVDATVVAERDGTITVQFSDIDGPVEFTFVADLSVDEADEATVREWYADWRTGLELVRPTDTEQAPAPATIEPITESPG